MPARFGSRCSKGAKTMTPAKKTYKDIGEIQKDYTSGCYAVPRPEMPEFVPLGYIFDEDKSVRENREMVSTHNEAAKKARSDYRLQLDQQEIRMRNDVKEYVAGAYGMSMASADIIERYTWEEYHSAVYDYLTAIEDVAEMVSSVVKNETAK